MTLGRIWGCVWLRKPYMTYKQRMRNLQLPFGHGRRPDPAVGGVIHVITREF